MGAIGGLLGTAGGASGTGFKTPQTVDITSPVAQDQVDASNAGVTQSLGSSDRLLAALQARNGAGNQSQVFDQGQALSGQLGGLGGTGAEGLAMGQQGVLNTQLGQAGGVGLQQGAARGLQDVLAGQQGTAAQYQGIANGTGPNPAQAALNQSTGQNVANQAALMAGQRGAGTNVGLLARQAAQQGANTQQQAVGQAATLQANQQIAGLQGLAGMQAAMGNTNQLLGGLGSGLVGQQQTGINQQYGQGAGVVGQQQGQFGINAGIANNQVGNTLTATGQNTQGHLGNAGQTMGAAGNYNTNQVNQQGNVNTVSGGLAQTGMKGQQDMIGGLMGSVGAAAGMPAGAQGGYVTMADGGFPAPDGQGPLLAAPVQPGPVAPPPPGAQSSFGQFLAGGNTGSFLASQPLQQTVTPDTTQASNAQMQQNSNDSELKKGSASMGKMAMMAAMAAKGGQVQHDYRAGGGVQAKNPAEKAVKPGNSYANDKVKALLSEGEVVIPRSVMASRDPVRASADFVAKVMARRKAKPA